MSDIDTALKLSNFIREVDGNHRMGACELAERITDWFALHQQEQADPVGHVFPDDIKMLEAEECCVSCYSVAQGHPEYGETEPLYRHPPSAVPEALIDALKSHSQGDEEGVMCIVSRQAVCEAVDILEALSAAPQPKETGE